MRLNPTSLTCLTLSWVCACAIPRQMTAAPDDFADYRAFRLASDEGTRLARATTYLERHPRGRWVSEVREAFEAEEDAWFENAKRSRSAARDYLVDLPHGPHAEAARALLVLFDERETDVDMLELLAAWRRTSVLLDRESERRRRVGEVVLEELAALLDPMTWGADLDDPPQALALVLRGSTRRSWGSGPRASREDAIFFVLPTSGERAASVAEVKFQLVEEEGLVRGARIEGPDLFVRWAEANDVRVLDASRAPDRAAAAAEVGDLLGGAFEARLPASRCTARLHEGEIAARACDGWHVSARMGLRAGDSDVIAVRGPRAP